VWDDLETVPWASLQHNYGSAKDVPGLLRASAAGDRDAFMTLDNHLFHQGGWVCSAATAALPFLVRIAADTRHEFRADVLDTITLIIRESISVEERHVDDNWPAALTLELPRLLQFLSDPDPQVRRMAACQAASLPVDAAVTALMARWVIEPDRIARWDITLSLGDLLARTPAPQAAAEVVDLLNSLLTRDDQQLALAAVHALHRAGKINPVDHLDLMLRAVTGEVTGWTNSAHVGGGRSVVMAWAGELLTEDPVAASTFAIGVGRGASDPEQRVAMAQAAGTLLQDWRTPATSLLPELIAWLVDPEPEVRYRGAFLLGGLGDVAAEHADALALVSTDTTIRSSRSGLTVGAAGQWALSRLGDARCVPGLVHQLTLAGPGSESPAYFSISPHVPYLPTLHEQLVPLPQFSEAFLPHLRRILNELRHHPNQPGAHQWTKALAAWGPAAAGAVPELTALLSDEKTWWPAAHALAQIGPAAATAGSSLRPRAATSFDAAWAYWRITGHAGPVLSICEKTMATNSDTVSLERVGDLGPLAVQHIDVFRETALAGTMWTRIYAARACWTTGGDEETALSVLLDTVRPLTTGKYLPVQWTALRYLAEIGPAAASAAPVAQAVIDHPRRIASHGGWRVFAEDDDIRAAATAVLRMTG
jgi:HEAT repeat protein